MLELSGLSKHFGGVKAVDGLDLTVNEGEIFGLIGPNGSGKSTTINLICGVFAETAGTVRFRGDLMNGKPPHRRLRAGIARTFQNIRLFPNLTVWQNLWVAQNSRQDVATQGFLPRWFGATRRTRQEIAGLLELADLGHKDDELASNLAFGEQRRLEFARAAAARPKLLLLDEPAAGMNQQEIDDLSQRIRRVRDSGVTILLVEHVMELVMGVTEQMAVLNFGRKIASGTPGEVQRDRAVQEAYLGTAGSTSRPGEGGD
ncbi:MAG: ABC transporter ATP-binding protein [Deltaproteobacteria bacterium]|nr:ABC transporter ATP-binding protein [Deltaproteobacteria bacterium]MDE0354598.1 ABC transporter ATP-binding protein [Deltaproteobacteria bacterium]